MLDYLLLDGLLFLLIRLVWCDVLPFTNVSYVLCLCLVDDLHELLGLFNLLARFHLFRLSLLLWLQFEVVVDFLLLALFSHALMLFPFLPIHLLVRQRNLLVDLRLWFFPLWDGLDNLLRLGLVDVLESFHSALSFLSGLSENVLLLLLQLSFGNLLNLLELFLVGLVQIDFHVRGNILTDFHRRLLLNFIGRLLQ